MNVKINELDPFETAHKEIKDFFIRTGSDETLKDIFNKLIANFDKVETVEGYKFWLNVFKEFTTELKFRKLSLQNQFDPKTGEDDD